MDKTKTMIKKNIANNVEIKNFSPTPFISFLTSSSSSKTMLYVNATKENVAPNKIPVKDKIKKLLIWFMIILKIVVKIPKLNLKIKHQGLDTCENTDETITLNMLNEKLLSKYLKKLFYYN